MGDHSGYLAEPCTDAKLCEGHQAGGGPGKLWVNADGACLGIRHGEAVAQAHRKARNKDRPGRMCAGQEQHGDQDRKRGRAGAPDPDHIVEPDAFCQARTRQCPEEEAARQKHEVKAECGRREIKRFDDQERCATRYHHEHTHSAPGVSGISNEGRGREQSRECPEHLQKALRLCRGWPCLAEAGQHRRQCNKAHGGGDHEHGVPPEYLGNKAAKDRCEDRGEDDDRHDLAQDPRRFLPIVEVADDGAGHHDPGAAAQRLHNTADNEKLDVRRPDAKRAPGCIEDEPADGDGTAAEAIGGGAEADGRYCHSDHAEGEGELGDGIACVEV